MRGVVTAETPTSKPSPHNPLAHLWISLPIRDPDLDQGMGERGFFTTGVSFDLRRRREVSGRRARMPAFCFRWGMSREKTDRRRNDASSLE